MTKKGKRTALLQRAGEIGDLQAENEQLRARLAECEKGPGPSRLYGLLADNASDVIWLADMDLNLTYVSPSAARMLGCGPEEVMTPAVKEMLLPEPVCRHIADSRERMAPDGGAAFHGQRGLTLETRLHIGDGSDIWVEDSIDFVRGEGGRLAGVMGIVRDVTGRKQAEEELRLSGERSRLLLENASEGIAVVQDGVLRLVNPRLAQMSGYTMEELISRPFVEVVHPDDRERVVGHYARRIEDEETSQIYQYRFVDKAGRTRWGETNVARIEWEGKPAILAVVGDVSERVAAQQALEESERLYRLLADSSSDVIWTSDLDIRITYVSPSVTRVLGYSPDEIKAMPFERWFSPPSLDLVARIRGEDIVTESRRPGSMAERVVDVEMVTRDGSLVWVEAAISGIRDAEGRLVGFQGACREITQRKKAQEAMAASEERFRTIFERSPLGTVVYDADSAPVEINRACMEMFGVSREVAMRGPSLFDFPVLADGAKQRLRAGKTVAAEAPVDLDLFRESGLYPSVRSGKLFVRIILVPLGAEQDGSPRGYLLLLEDVTERKRVEAALQRQERFFRAVTENSTDGILVADREGNVKYESPGARRLLGLSRDRTGESVTGPIHPDDLPAAAGVLEQVLSGQPARVEMRARHADGSWRTIDSTLVNLLDDPGVEGIVVNMRDVTERKRAEQALRESEERLRREEHLFRMLTESSSDVVLLVNPDGTIRYESPAVERVLGLKPEERVGDSVFENLRPDERPVVAETFAKMKADPRSPSERHEIHLRHRDGSWRTLESLANLIVHDSVIEGVMVNLRDITERKKGEEALREAKEYAEYVLRTANVLVVVLDTEGKTVLLNEAGEKMTGYSQSEVVGKDWFDLVVPRERYPQVREAFSDDIAAGTVADTFENAILTRSGEERIVSWKNSVLVRNGETAGTLSFGRDITDRRRAEEALLKAHAELEARVEQRTAELKEANELLVVEMRQRQQAQGRLQESEARYRELVESANSIIMELDTRGKVTFFNRFAREFYGFKESEIIGRQVVGTIAPPVDSAGNDMKARVKDLVKHPEEHPAIEGEGMLRNGDRVWISWTNKGLYDSRGRLRNLLCIGMDRTEQRRTAEMLAEQAKETAAAEERQRLARELHDAVTQMLFSASIIAAVLPRLWAKDREEGLRRLDELRQLTRGALAEMRLLLLELRPAALAEVGLGDLLRHLAEATSGRAGFPVSFTFEGQCTVPADVQMALYRVSQEALANAAKHSRASEAKVHLLYGRRSATVTVADNGCGFDVKRVSPEHLGLRIMQERAEAVGAAVTVVSSKRRGTEVRAVWPKAGRKERP